MNEGIYNHWVEKWKNAHIVENLNNIKHSEYVYAILDLKRIKGIFYLLFIGLLLSIICLICELDLIHKHLTGVCIEKIRIRMRNIFKEENLGIIKIDN